jgi:predicted AAA+ superfamily ATPase
MFTRSSYLEKIKPFIDKPVIKVLTGIRRSGKSTLLKMIIQELKSKGVQDNQIIYINKDSLEFEFIQTYLQLYEYVKGKFPSEKTSIYLFVDEIQEIEFWEKAIGSFHTDEIADLYITGSNSSLMSSELATLLTGRYIEFFIQPLVFSEFLEFREAAIHQSEVEFEHYLKYGGFPGLHHMEFTDDVIKQYLDAIYNTVILKDVVARNNIRDVHLLERIIRFIADNVGNITTAKNISNFIKSQHLKVSVDTVQNYIKWLMNAFIIHKVPRYDIRGKAQLELYEKYFLSDIGFIYVLSGNKFADISGKLENVIFLELIHRGYAVEIGKWNQLEVDFIASKNGKKIYFQVAYLLSDEKVISREFGSLMQIQDAYPKYVLSMDKHFGDDLNGIKWMNIKDFLLSKDW